MKTPFAFVLLSALSVHAAAQTGDEGAAPPEGGTRRWSVGVAAIVSDSPFAGEGTRVQPIPLVTYEGERFFFRGVTAGWRFIDGEAFTLSALGKFRFDGFDAKDLGVAELAARGVDRDLLDDRDLGFDLGLGMTWRGAGGELELELLADATDTSGGQEATLQYGYPMPVGQGRLTPGVGVTWMSDDMANYHYGTLDEEVARGVVDYRPGSATVPHVGLSYVRPIGRQWAMLGFAKYSRLPDALSDSPLVEADTDDVASVFVGFSRGF